MPNIPEVGSLSFSTSESLLIWVSRLPSPPSIYPAVTSKNANAVVAASALIVLSEFQIIIRWDHIYWCLDSGIVVNATGPTWRNESLFPTWLYNCFKLYECETLLNLSWRVRLSFFNGVDGLPLGPFICHGHEFYLSRSCLLLDFDLASSTYNLNSEFPILEMTNAKWPHTTRLTFQDAFRKLSFRR